MPEALLGKDVADLRELLGSGERPYRARQLYHALYRQPAREIEEITTLPAGLRRELAERYCVGWPRIEQRFDSVDGTRRYLLRLADGRTVEAVYMPEQVRHTFCISTQVGCPAGCKFCLTALMGLERNLSAGEIVGQVLVLAHDNRLELGRDRVNIVMMGMGEPLLNLDNVLKASRLLMDPDGVGISPRRVTLSTVGITPKIVELGQAEVRPKLAVSLNASSQEQRLRLMPVARKYPLDELLEVCRTYPLRPWERLTFEYVLLKGANDSEADARAVVRLLARIKCKVNLIALNPGPGIPFETPEPERVLAFQRILRRSMPCFIRKPRGRDIYAACGQLRRMSVEAAA
ncbi:MAG: 23S rRNA (adenine(2503)-C(2))-methyltransferase RlmN [Bryobacterales bacterium]|nr:23S rRNA (adenine(2503)-C(2))-methyltransferase RlmN [Bryobacterales bacterium]